MGVCVCGPGTRVLTGIPDTLAATAQDLVCLPPDLALAIEEATAAGLSGADWGALVDLRVTISRALARGTQPLPTLAYTSPYLPTAGASIGSSVLALYLVAAGVAALVTSLLLLLLRHRRQQANRP